MLLIDGEALIVVYKLITREVNTQFFLKVAFLRKLLSNPQSASVKALIPSLVTSLTILACIKDCRSINKLFNIDSFLDCEGHSNIFTRILSSHSPIHIRQHLSTFSSWI